MGQHPNKTVCRNVRGTEAASPLQRFRDRNPRLSLQLSPTGNSTSRKSTVNIQNSVRVSQSADPLCRPADA
ncbi:MAG: hypothetical protein AAGA40_16525 [Cyanobacteria bacterium P01_E01_bin.45]